VLKSVKKAEQKVVNDPNANKVGPCAIRSFCFIKQTRTALEAHAGIAFITKMFMLLVQAVLQEYLGIAGNPDFCKLSAKLAFGADSKALQEGRAATVQSLSGTGSLRVCIQKCLLAHS